MNRIIWLLQALELDDTLQCVVECRSLARLETPIAFGVHTYHMVLGLVRRHIFTHDYYLKVVTFGIVKLT